MLSLRQRLISWQMVFLATVLVAFAAISYTILANGLAGEIDNTLRERAEHVDEALQVVPNRRIELAGNITDEFALPGVYAQILTVDGAVVARSDNLGRQRLPVSQDLLAQVLAGSTLFKTESVDGRRIRLYHRAILRNGEPVGAVQVGQSLQGLMETLRRLQTIYLIGIIGALLSGTGISLLLIGLNLRPISEIARTASRIAESGDLTSRLHYRPVHDEIGDLAEAFNLMMARLDSSVGLQRRFVADTAHELRTPLATILGNADLLVRYGHVAERRDWAVAAIKREGERTARLATSLLLLAQADAGQAPVIRPVEWDEVLIEVYEQLLRLQKKCKLVMKRCDPIRVLGDSDQLKQVILNLVENAVQHTSPQGRVTLSLINEDDQAHLIVADTGSGIPAAELPRVFERFYKGPNSISGSGLGLSIVKWIVDEHRGDISFESEPNRGTVVTISLPVLTEQYPD